MPSAIGGWFRQRANEADVDAPGRNDPCPCGSGRKYKRCCSGREGSAPGALPAAFTQAERQRAFSRLVSFATEREFDDDHAAALLVYWAAGGGKEFKEIAAVVGEPAQAAYLTWFAVDMEMEEGDTVLNRFLARRGGDLPAGEAEYLRRLRGTHIRLYEVLEVRRDEGVLVRDLWNDEEIAVRERSATHQLVRWDLLGARLIEGPGGAVEFEGIPFLFPVELKDELLGALRRAHKVIRKKSPHREDAVFFKGMAPYLNVMWLDRVVLRAPPTIATSEGDPLVLTKVVFDVDDADAARRILEENPDFDAHDDGTFSWSEEAELYRRTLGSLTIRGKRLTLEAMSEERGVRGRQLIESMLGERARYRATRVEDAIAAGLRAPPTKGRRSEALPPEVEARVLGEFYDRYYRQWLDQPLPALGGRSPRHAARLKTGRPKLVALLKDLENRTERERQGGRPAYDTGWLWNELGVERG